MNETKNIRKHFLECFWIHELLSDMDEKIKPIMGLNDFDDAVCVDLKSKIIASTDGPYEKRLTLKSALIHACTDVWVKGGKPIFALNNLFGTIGDCKEMLEALHTQSKGIGLPILGGNTKYSEENPMCCITVIGELILDSPIRDCGAKSSDVIAIMGEPLWGEMDERIEKANALFAAWSEALANIQINSAKDVTKGGFEATSYEMMFKSKKEFELLDFPYSTTRNLDNFLLTLSEKDFEKLKIFCDKHKCVLHKIGFVK